MDSLPGLRGSVVRDVLRKQAPRFRFLCEKRYPRTHRELDGTVTLELRIAASGAVDSAALLTFPEEPSQRSEDFLRAARSLRFPAAPGGTRLLWTFRLKARALP